MGPCLGADDVEREEGHWGDMVLTEPSDALLSGLVGVHNDAVQVTPQHKRHRQVVLALTHLGQLGDAPVHT